MTDPWAEKPEPVWVPRSYYSKSKIKEDDIQMILIDHAWLEKLKEEWDAILQHHITQEKGMQKEIDALKEKAEKWTELFKCLKWGNDPPVEIILRQFHALNTGNQDKRKKLEAVREFVLSRRDDIERGIEDFGMLNPVLEYFSEEAARAP